MKKTVIHMALAVVLVAVLSVGGTVAYFIYRNAVNNRLSVGENTIKITEDFAPPKQMDVGENIYKKDVRIKNTGTIPCYVRVYAGFSDSAVEEKSELSPNGTDFYAASSYKDNLPDGWVYIAEDENAELGGYYYYTKTVEAGKQTDSLFRKVKTTFPDANSVQDYEIIVYAESVQTADKNGREFTGNDTWKQAWQEFLERK